MKKTRQRITLVLMTAMIALLFTGCVKLDTSITIKKDGRIDLDMIYAVDEDYMDSSSMINSLSDEDKSMLAAVGITVSEYSEGGYTGVRVSGENVKLSEDVGSALNDIISYDMNILSYSVDGNKVSITAFQDDAESEEPISSSEYGSLISLSGASAKVKITFPEGSKIIESNATSVSDDGLTLTWNLFDISLKDGLRVDFEMPTGASVSLTYALIGGGIGAVVIIVILVVILIKYNKKQKAEAAARMYAYGQNSASYAPPQNLPDSQSNSVPEQDKNNQS